MQRPSKLFIFIIILLPLLALIWTDTQVEKLERETFEYEQRTEQEIRENKIRYLGWKKDQTEKARLDLEAQLRKAQEELAVQRRRQVKVASYGPITGDVWYRLRICESGNNYANKNNPRYRGAYQYDFSTWNNYQGYYDPADAPSEVQDTKARADQARRGWRSLWPACSVRLGLT